MQTHSGGLTVQVLHFDNALEFLVQRLRDAAAASGTDIRTTVAYAPEQNGRVEKAGHILVCTATAIALFACLAVSSNESPMKSIAVSSTYPYLWAAPGRK